MYAELSDVRCYYEILGQGEPLLMIAGLGGTCASWDGVANELAQSFTLIMPELRGIGRSEGRGPARNLSYLAADLIELLDHLQLDRAHVLGISLGGILAQEVAIEHPSRVDKLVLISCGHRFGPYLREMATLLGQALRHFPRETYEHMIEVLSCSPQYVDNHPAAFSAKIHRDACGGASRKSIANQLRCLGMTEMGGPDYLIEAPTLVMAGEYDTLIPHCYAREMASQIPDSRFLLISDCGHNPMIEKPDIVLPKIRQFLTSKARSHEAKLYQLPMEELV